MADGKAEGARRAFKRSEARKFAELLHDHAGMLLQRVGQDRFDDADLLLDYCYAYAENLRDILTDLKRG